MDNISSLKSYSNPNEQKYMREAGALPSVFEFTRKDCKILFNPEEEIKNREEEEFQHPPSPKDFSSTSVVSNSTPSESKSAPDVSSSSPKSSKSQSSFEENFPKTIPICENSIKIKKVRRRKEEAIEDFGNLKTRTSKDFLNSNGLITEFQEFIGVPLTTNSVYTRRNMKAFRERSEKFTFGEVKVFIDKVENRDYYGRVYLKKKIKGRKWQELTEEKKEMLYQEIVSKIAHYVYGA